MSRIAATTSGWPWSWSGLRAISTTTSVPSLRRATRSVCLPIGRARGSRAKPRRYSAWRGRMLSGTSSSMPILDQLLDRVAEQAAGGGIGEDDPAVRRRRRPGHRGRRRRGCERRRRSPVAAAARRRRGGRAGGLMAAASAAAHRRHQDVAGAADRLDDPRIVDIRLELLAQPPDLDVDGPVERRRLAPAGLLEQEVARQDAAGMGDEDARAGRTRRRSARPPARPGRPAGAPPRSSSQSAKR